MSPSTEDPKTPQEPPKKGFIKNGHYIDPNALPYATRQSLTPRTNEPKTGYVRALPGSAIPGRKAEPLIFPPQYTEKPTEIGDTPLPGSGLNPHKDPILNDPFRTKPDIDKFTHFMPAEDDNGIPIDPTERIHPQNQEPTNLDPRIANARKALAPKTEHLGMPGVKFPKSTPPNPLLPSAGSERTYDPNAGVPRPNPVDALFQSQYQLPNEFNVTDVKALAKLYTREAVEILMEVARDPKANANARVNAADAVLNRGWGKPEVQVQTTIKRSIAEFSDDEIMAILSSAAVVIDNDSVSQESHVDDASGGDDQPGEVQLPEDPPGTD